MATTNSMSSKSAARAPARVVLVKSNPAAIASSTIGKAIESAGASGSGAPKFFTASRVPVGSISFVTQAMPKIALSAIRRTTVIRCIEANEIARVLNKTKYGIVSLAQNGRSQYSASGFSSKMRNLNSTMTVSPLQEGCSVSYPF